MEKETWITEVLNSSKYPTFDVESNFNRFNQNLLNSSKINISLNWFWPVAAIWLVSTYVATKKLEKTRMNPQTTVENGALNELINNNTYQIY